MTTTQVQKLKELSNRIESCEMKDVDKLIELFKEVRELLMPYYVAGQTDDITTLLYVLKESETLLNYNLFDFIRISNPSQSLLTKFSNLKQAPLGRIKLLLLSNSQDN